MAYDEFVDSEIEELGDSVTLRVISKGTPNKWGDLNQSSTSDTSTIAVSNILGNEDLEVREGLYQNGDKRFFFQTDESNLETGNQIYHDSLWYKIKEVLKHKLGNEIAGYEVLASKV